MYKRAYGQRRPPLIPPNYSGNAFRQEEAVDNASLPDVNAEPREEEQVMLPPSSDNEQKKETRTAPLFTDLLRGGLGNEELLILALIFLVSQSGGDDLLPFLVILLFSK